MQSDRTKPLVRALTGEALRKPPWWLMRQAGRYLPEYREVRAKARDFIELCLTPSLAAEVTMQPVRRYGMGAAILFSDILMLPYALGQRVSFQEGEGPVLDPIEDQKSLLRLDYSRAISRLEPVFETVQRVREAIGAETTLIGFAGAPWTVATYMVEGGSSREFQRIKSWAYRDPQGLTALIELLKQSTIEYLAAQIEAGAEVVQLFDTWAGVLPEAVFERWVIEPTQRIVAELGRRFPECPVIGFPRSAGPLYERYVKETGVAGIGLDSTMPTDYAAKMLQPLATIQGNLDPVLLIIGGAALANAVTQLRQKFGQRPYVFNLGHGILPDTPPENVGVLARLLAEPLAA